MNTAVLRTLSCVRPFSSYKLRDGARTKHLDKALRILDIISPKKSTATASQNHVRLIQDLLQTAPNHLAGQCISSDFIFSKSVKGVSSSFEEVLGSSVEENEDLDSDAVTLDASLLSNAVSSCGSARDLQGGSQYHCLAIRTGFVASAYVGSSLVTLYCKCGEMENAYKMFEEMPVRNVVSWTAIISGFAKEWQVDVCLQLFSVMRNSALKPNDFTFTSLLSACTGSGALGQGRSAHCQTIQMGFDSYLHIANALVSMYCKCGSVEDALYVFKSTVIKDVVSWNSMISGYAQHGLAILAIEVFEEMKKLGVKPDGITFLGVLSSCRHAGFVEEGRKYFNSMVEYGLCPELDHYSCLVDLLGRAGLIEEARDFILSMPISPNAVIWGSLLSSCRVHGRVWIGIQAAESRLLLEPYCAATHVQLANLYASVRCWDHAAKTRKLMKDQRLKTHAGYSWIEIKNVVYRFRAEDDSNIRLNETLIVLDCLFDHMLTLAGKIQEEVCDTL